MSVIDSFSFTCLFCSKSCVLFTQISLTFLLAADDAKLARYFLQELIVLSNCPENSSEILTKFARERPENWRSKIVEALCSIQAKQIIRKLGLDPADMSLTYMPHIRDRSIFIHRIVKALYCALCENLPLEQSRLLINHIMATYCNLVELPFKGDGAKYLEVHLLHWIADGVIDVGEEMCGNSNGRPCNLKAIIMCLKLNEIDKIKDELQISMDGFNRSIASNITDENRASGSYRGFAEQAPQVNCDSAYIIRRDQAGVLLIINQRKFHRDDRREFQVTKRNSNVKKKVK